MADKTCRAALLLAALALTGCSQGHSQPATPSPAPLAVDPVQLSEVLDGALRGGPEAALESGIRA